MISDRDRALVELESFGVIARAGFNDLKLNSPLTQKMPLRTRRPWYAARLVRQHRLDRGRSSEANYLVVELSLTRKW
jgi:hypothetical protein